MYVNKSGKAMVRTEVPINLAKRLERQAKRNKRPVAREVEAALEAHLKAGQR